MTEATDTPEQATYDDGNGLYVDAATVRPTAEKSGDKK